MAAQKRPEADPAVKRIIDEYHEQFLARHGRKPLISGGKDGSLIRKMLATWGEETVRTALAAFVRGNDSWAVKRGWTLAAFYDVAPRLVVLGSSGDSRTAANADAIRAATRPVQSEGVVVSGATDMVRVRRG